MTHLDALALPANQRRLHAAVVHPQDPALADQLHVVPGVQSVGHSGFLPVRLGGSLGVEEAESHIPLQDVEVPRDHRLTFQDLYNYLEPGERQKPTFCQGLYEFSGPVASGQHQITRVSGSS